MITSGLLPRLLLDEIADHALALVSERIKWARLGRAIGVSLRCERANCRTVAVGDDDTMAGMDDFSQGSRVNSDPLSLTSAVSRSLWIRRALLPGRP